MPSNTTVRKLKAAHKKIWLARYRPAGWVESVTNIRI